MKKTLITSLMLTVAAMTNAAQLPASAEITQKIRDGHNFAYQGTFPKIDGELIGEWKVSGVSYELIENDGEFNNTIQISGNSGTGTLRTKVPISGGIKNIAISMEGMLETAKSALSGFSMGFHLVNEKGETVIRQRQALYKKGEKLPWEIYNYAADIPRQFESGTLTISIQIIGDATAQAKNIHVTELPADELAKILPRIPKANTNYRKKPRVRTSLADTMRDLKYVEMIWRARRPSQTDASEFYVHYIQGAMQLSDAETTEKIRSRNLSADQLKELSDRARERKGLPPVQFR